MEEKINLKHLEKNTAAQTFQTGVIDIEIGLIWIVGSLAMIFDHVSYYLMTLYVIPLIFIILATRYIIHPRLGIVKFQKSRVKRNRTMNIVITVFLIIMVSLTAFGNMKILADFINPRWVITGIILLICIAIAYFLNFNRMYFYAFLFAAAFNISEEVRGGTGIISDTGFPYLIASIILFIIGTYYLVKFLKKYPVPKTND